nr:MAG TPA: hypothetical protein [Caudoviricetes sp.]
MRLEYSKDPTKSQLFRIFRHKCIDKFENLEYN